MTKKTYSMAKEISKIFQCRYITFEHYAVEQVLVNAWEQKPVYKDHSGTWAPAKIHRNDSVAAVYMRSSYLEYPQTAIKEGKVDFSRLIYDFKEEEE